ncbi:DNA/RNA non-specific endonuclease [Arthrobacter sp. JZ12]|uniref:DNA/RNA non-specific endonuclease n=1 Tax=Arthrobacter sp. JZ12 TaxID=2654190 RepID=UPI002B4A75AE|nr:DNA/RNA non-specific endonuclease [Arthrobacter sp. JZ12]WRH24036.1 DNA/RNA non-specific endonuclease [Arthrobacter sp. JZ12]
MDALLPETLTMAIDDLSDRQGYDENFLGIPLPLPSLQYFETTVLPYTNFSIVMRPDKRLAAVTALGIDGSQLMELGREGIDWRLDPRLPEDHQTGERVYARNGIDRGHLVRRASAVWGGTRDQAAQANADTFFYTNAAPQAARFNQSLELWLGLETYLLENAADHGRRLTVFTGPIFSEQDPLYRGTEIPLRYFKIAAFLVEGQLGATGYVVDQTPQLGELPDVPPPGALDEAPPLRPFRTFQVPVRDIEALTGLNLGQLVAADRMPIATALPTATITSAWRQLSSPECLDLDFDLQS